MNKIYKLVRNNSTGKTVVASEFAKGAKKGSTINLTICLLSTLFSTSALSIGVPQFSPSVNDHHNGVVNITGSGQVIDLGENGGFSATEKGQEVAKHVISTSDSAASLYKIKYKDVQDAQAAWETAVNNEETQAIIDALKQDYDDKVTLAEGISDDKFKINDPSNLVGKNTEGVTITEKEVKYKDVISGTTFKLKVKDKLEKIEAGTSVTGGGVSFEFYEKMPDTDQYNEMEMVEVSGNATDVTVINNGSNDCGNLNAIGKNGSAVILVKDGANLTYDAETNYYTGGSKSISEIYIDQFDSDGNFQSTHKEELFEINFKGTVETALGSKTINNEDDFNKFNKELIKFIQTDPQIRLEYSTVEEMQAFYDSQINSLYQSDNKGAFEVIHTISRDELEQLVKDQNLEDEFNNKVTQDDRYTDLGLSNNSSNYFIGVDGSGSVINITNNAVIKNYTIEDGKKLISSGAVIKANFTNSGATANNKINIDGTIEVAKTDDENYFNRKKYAIIANNAEVNVSNTGVIQGDIAIKGDGNGGNNALENSGKIKGDIEIANGKLNNNNTIEGEILAENSNITNKDGATIKGNIKGYGNSVVKNESGATIDGNVTVIGSGTSFINDGIVGAVQVENGATVSNNHIIVGNGTVNLGSGSTLNNDGDIYIGYYDDNGVMKVGDEKSKYVAINVAGSGTQLSNNKNIHVAGNQKEAVIVQVTNKGSYVQSQGSTLNINEENDVISNLDPEEGNNNKAIFVDGLGSTAKIEGTITLADSGSTALHIQNGGAVTLGIANETLGASDAGSINLNSKNIDNVPVSNFGAWVAGTDSTLLMQGNATIKMDADRAIGVHVRDGATATINDHAGITFGNNKNQLGFLISGISSPASIIYNSDKDLKLNGEGSVLFRIERGSQFNTGTIHAPSNSSLSELDSNFTKDSTLIVITNGATPAGVSNQTQADLNGFSLNVNGENAKGISVEGGAHVKITEQTAISLSGQNSILAKVDGWYYDLNGQNDATYNGDSIIDSYANLTSDPLPGSTQIVNGQDSIGYYLTHGGALNHYGTIAFKSPSKNNIGVKIDSGGKLTSEQGSSIYVYGTAVEISGDKSQAIINNNANGTAPIIWAVGSTDNDSAYHVKDNASLTLTGSGVTKAEGTAHGVLVDGASKLVLDSAIIDLYNSGTTEFSSGNGIENRSSLTNIQLTNNATINVKDGYGIHSSVGFTQANKTSGTINVHGNGAGVRFENIDATTGAILGTTNNAITNNGYENVVINVHQAGQGIYVDSSKNVHTSGSVNILTTAGHSALEIKGTTDTASQSGNLHSTSGSNTIIDLNNGYMNKFTNNGDVLYGGFTTNSSGGHDFTQWDKNTAATHEAIKTNSTENALHFTNDTKGNINGKVVLDGFGDASSPTDTSIGNTVELKGAGNIFVTGQGDDKFIVHTVVGDDLGGTTQVKQFTQLDGGAGDDQITFNTNTDFTISKDSTLKDIEYIALNGNSKVTLNNLNTTDGLNTGTTTYDIKDTGSKLTYLWNHDATSFDRLLNGNGTFKVDLVSLDSDNKPTHEFAFDASTNSGAFNGTLELSNTNYTLADSTAHNNTGALTNATLKASDNSQITVGNGTQTIGGLAFNGGTVDFGQIDVSQTQSDNHIATDTLTLDKGNVQINVTGSIYNPNIPSSLSLLEQDDGITYTQLVSANNVTGGAINVDIDRDLIKLYDQQGNEVTDPTTTLLVQNGEEVARATYDTRLSKGQNSDGLYVGYGLTKVELKTKNDGNNALILDATASDPSKASTSDFDAIIADYDNGDGTFSYGDLQIKGNKAVTLSGNNTYHGSTYVKDTSSLVLGGNSALGESRLVMLDSNTKLDLNGKNQAIGSLVTSTDSTVSFNNGSLTLTGIDGTHSGATLNSYIESETLSGSGRLIIGDDSLNTRAAHYPVVSFNGNNSLFTADIDIAANGTAVINDYGSLGTGSLNNGGELNLNLNTDGQLTNATINDYVNAGGTTIAGVINKYGSGTLTLTAPQAQYTGETNINAGVIVLDGANAASNTFDSKEINIGANASLAGYNSDAGFANSNAVTLTGKVNNSGTFYVGSLADGVSVNSNSSVTIGSYHGNAGSNLVFNGVLSDDNSPINSLIITSGSTSGESSVTVNNIGGLGAQTIEGIKLIDVQNHTAGNNNAVFNLLNRVIAGAYEYKLVQNPTGHSSGSVGSWFLRSSEAVRPEVGGYISNLAAANNMFSLRLHDRLGETQYTDLVTGEQKVTSMWLRHQYGYDEYRAGSNSLSVDNNWNVSQLGGDIAQWTTNGLDRFHLGVMAGHGRNTGTSKSKLTHKKSDSTVKGYSYGLYGTWYHNNEDKTGLYVDSWLLWNDMKGSISGDGTSEKYNLKGLTASLESGYSFKTGTLGNFDVWLQPKGQLTWFDVKAKNYVESNGSRVSSDHGNLQTRLGLRTSLLSNQQLYQATGHNGQVFIEANWLYNSKRYDVTLNDEVTISQDGARNIGEIKIGVEGSIKDNTNVWVNLSNQRGSQHYENASINLGLKYSF